MIKKKDRERKKIRTIKGDKIKDGIYTKRDITSNFMTVSLKINKMNKLLEKISTYQVDSRKNRKPDWS